MFLVNLDQRFDFCEKILLVPIYVDLNDFESRKTLIMNMDVGRLGKQRMFMNGAFASVNLIDSQEDLTGIQTPKSLIEKTQQIKSMGGIQYLETLLNDLPTLLQRNREILNESIRLLDDEENSDHQLREQFKERWTMTPSEDLTKPMKDEAMKYKTILDTAVNADKIIRNKYNANKNAITLLSNPAEINRKFCQDKEIRQCGAKSEQLAKNLVSGFHMFMELIDNLEEETKFYKDLTPLLLRLQNKISDFCQKRMT
ncbi:hypothetical protein CHS0354_019641 [Potamilus streckersoni]|uniref:ALIX V-shaped domain-containing protein n=1 Tax=Potamilus streckersoni TaxID=2493646 RepID=A0AAE0T900_9BIVA|nr:hypothetical protein CHS0354_019641 [Potamilus streckersoni]